MTTTVITPQLKVTMLKHLVAGKNLDFVADVTGLSRDTVLDIVSAHGYPKINSMKWSIDCLIKDADKIPVREVDYRPRVLLDEPAAPTHESIRVRNDRLSVATVAHVPPATADLLHQAEQSPFIRTQNIGTKISALLADLTARLNDEQQQVEAKASADREAARIASRIATLQAEIDKLKRKPAKTATGQKLSTTGQKPSYTQQYGEFACTTPACERVFTTIQGAVTHRRRAHEGFNPHAKAAS